MELGAEGGEAEGGGGGEEGREGVGVEGDGERAHAAEEAEGGGGVVVAADVGDEEGVVLGGRHRRERAAFDFGDFGGNPRHFESGLCTSFFFFFLICFCFLIGFFLDRGD